MQVNPNKPPHPGNFCVFRSCKDDVDIAIVKELRRFNDETWFVKELHPEERDFTLKRSEWTCHVVVAISRSVVTLVLTPTLQNQNSPAPLMDRDFFFSDTCSRHGLFLMKNLKESY